MLILAGDQYIKKIKLNEVKQRQLVDNIFKQSSISSIVPYFVGIAEFLTNVISLICRSFRLMLNLLNLPLLRESTSKDLIQIRLITLILKLLLAITEVVLSSMNGKS